MVLAPPTPDTLTATRAILPRTTFIYCDFVIIPTPTKCKRLPKISVLKHIHRFSYGNIN